ncbi:MAG: hypothetical protein DI585_04165 [Pseudomonas fluorescens]|nr:MAG: hypothetical protein DI585_04165 [Pseudomonas fluorescens]
MTTMAQRVLNMITGRMAMLVMLGLMGASQGFAEGYYHHTPSAPTTTSAPARTYHYNVGYRSGNSGFNFTRGYGGRDSSTGYTGANTAINTPHRSDWYSKLNAQRQWDNAQYQKMQQANNARCGFTGAPAYCYRLMGPYPQELRVVRY